MRISIVSDEISLDLQAAVHIGASWGIRQYELRGRMGSRLPDGISEWDINEMLRIASQYDISYSALSPGVFKCSPDPALIEQHLEERLPESIALAKKLDIKTIVIFALHDEDVHRPAELRDRLAPYLRQACERAAADGITLAVETEYMSGVETAADAAMLIEQAGAANLMVNWDVANAWIAGEEPRDGYDRIRGRIANVHVKDADTKAWRERNPFVTLGTGSIPWLEILPLLAKEPSVRAVTLETHKHPALTNSERGFQCMKQWLEQLQMREE